MCCEPDRAPPKVLKESKLPADTFGSKVVADVFVAKVYSAIVAADKLADVIKPTAVVAKTPVRNILIIFIGIVN